MTRYLHGGGEKTPYPGLVPSDLGLEYMGRGWTMEYYGLFRDAKHVNLYTVDWDGWDSVNKRFWFKWWSNIIDTIRLLWDPDNGRTISLFIDGEFRTELWRDIPLEIYPVINPRSPDRWSSVRLQDVPTLENACYKKVMELDPPPPL